MGLNALKVRSEECIVRLSLVGGMGGRGLSAGRTILTDDQFGVGRSREMLRELNASINTHLVWGVEENGSQ